MLIKHIAIENFRGIKNLDWHVDGRMICLLGPGDSTKTTVIDAIELALAPRWNVPFSDADFYQADVAAQIKILVTIGAMPEALFSEDRCGLYLRGYQPFKPFNEDPEDGWEPVVTVCLRVNDDLEPHWELVKEGITDPKLISWRDRERFCMARLGNDVDRHLTWSRGSALSRITEGSADASTIFASVNRAASDAISNSEHEGLAKAAKKVKDAANLFGVQLPELSAGLDTRTQGFGVSALALHDSNRIPVRGSGLGSRRLTGLAIQHEGLGPDSILLVDEIEHGLEPHRIRRLIKRLCEEPPAAQDGSGSKPENGAVSTRQVIMTTHSPTPIMALNIGSLRFVRSNKGTTSIQSVSPERTDAMQSIARRFSHAFLARKIIVCEGKTEEAVLRSLDDYWERIHNGRSFATCGVVAIVGGGRSDAPNVAVELVRLGYTVLYFGDSDQPLSVSESDLKKEGIAVALWDDNMAIEERIAADLPIPVLQSVLDLARSRYNDGHVRTSLLDYLNHSAVQRSLRISDWLEAGIPESQLRIAIGKAAKCKKGEWFKDISSGEELGQLIASNLPEIASLPLAQTLSVIEGWVYAE